MTRNEAVNYTIAATTAIGWLVATQVYVHTTLGTPYPTTTGRQ